MARRKKRSSILLLLLGKLLRRDLRPVRKTVRIREDRPSGLDLWFRRMVHYSRAGAARRNLEFSLTAADLLNQYNDQHGCCAYTGVPLVTAPLDGFTASIDRVDSSRGYVVGNVVLVGARLNIMKNQYPLADFVELCRLVSDQSDDPTSYINKLL